VKEERRRRRSAYVEACEMEIEELGRDRAA
jgi:hypothetical protein